MLSHTYHIHLDSDTIHLPNLDDLLGKDVEIVVSEVSPTTRGTNFDQINRLLTEKANPAFFSQIADPTAWQKQIRDEWE
jgi:hypothetical protein